MAWLQYLLINEKDIQGIYENVRKMYKNINDGFTLV